MEIPSTFRAEFISSIASAPTQEFGYLRLNLKAKLRTRLAKVKTLRRGYLFAKKILQNVGRGKNSSDSSLSIETLSLLGENVRDQNKKRVFVVVPYFLEMNGPTSHYGNLLEIFKKLNLDVNYVATERNYILNISTSSYVNFKNINLVGPGTLDISLFTDSIIINCGSPWVYQNLDNLNAKGNLVIDYLFNHVGHTRSNYNNKAKIFHTVCQHQKLSQILQESTNDISNYSYIPIPFPKTEEFYKQNLIKNVSPLWVGRLSPEKGVDRLIEIASDYFFRTGRPIRVIGSGPLARELTGAIKVGAVDYLGELSHSRTLSEIASSHVVINTSYVEGVSLVAMESLASDVFVISFEVGGMSELLWHPNMRINIGDNQDFLKLLASVENSQTLPLGTIPQEFLDSFHETSWRNLINIALKFLS